MALAQSSMNDGTANAYNKMASTAPKNPNPVDAVSTAHESVQRLVNHLSSLADRLVGPVPTGGSATSDERANTVFREIMDHAEGILMLADEGLEAVMRIERMLP